MTASSADLTVLLVRVEAAAPPVRWDDPLNDDLHLALGWTRVLDHEVYGGKHAPPWEWTDPDGQYCAHHIEDATRSLDAALALCTRVLPGWMLENLAEMSHECAPLAGRWLAQLRPRQPRRRMTGAITAENLRSTFDATEPSGGETAALALLAALLRALIASASTVEKSNIASVAGVPSSHSGSDTQDIRQAGKED